MIEVALFGSVVTGQRKYLQKYYLRIFAEIFTETCGGLSWPWPQWCWARTGGRPSRSSPSRRLSLILVEMWVGGGGGDNGGDEKRQENLEKNLLHNFSQSLDQVEMKCTIQYASDYPVIWMKLDSVDRCWPIPKPIQMISMNQNQNYQFCWRKPTVIRLIDTNIFYEFDTKSMYRNNDLPITTGTRLILTDPRLPFDKNNILSHQTIIMCFQIQRGAGQGDFNVHLENQRHPGNGWGNLPVPGAHLWYYMWKSGSKSGIYLDPRASGLGCQTN